jgi:hypothetical protein
MLMRTRNAVRIKAFMATLFASALLAVGAAAPAMSQPLIIIPGGLITIVIDDVEVNVPIGVAVNLCGVNAAVLAQDFSQEQEINCSATADVENVPAPFQP